MAQPIRSTRIFQFGAKLLGIIYALTGLQRLIGNGAFGIGEPRSIMDPVHSLDDEWKCTCCECRIEVKERDLTIY